MVSNQISPYIRLATYSTLTAPFEIKERILYDYELICVTDGVRKITIGGEVYLCRKGDVVLIPPNVEHKFACVDGQDFVQPHIHFDAVYDAHSEERVISFKNRQAMTLRERALVCEGVLQEYKIPFVFSPKEKKSFYKLFFEIIDIFIEKKRGYALKYKARMIELLSLLAEQFYGEEKEVYSVAEDRAKTVKEYMESNFQQAITLDVLAKQFYVNKFTLERSFLKAYQTGVMSYYKKLRVAYAQNRLKTTAKTIGQIGEELSFADVFTFSRFFKKQTGVSPSAYRKAFLAKK